MGLKQDSCSNDLPWDIHFLHDIRMLSAVYNSLSKDVVLKWCLILHQNKINLYNVLKGIVLRIFLDLSHPYNLSQKYLIFYLNEYPEGRKKTFNILSTCLVNFLKIKRTDFSRILKC